MLRLNRLSDPVSALKLSRRGFLRTLGGAGAGLIVAVKLPGIAQAQRSGAKLFLFHKLDWNRGPHHLGHRGGNEGPIRSDGLLCVLPKRHWLDRGAKFQRKGHSGDGIGAK